MFRAATLITIIFLSSSAHGQLRSLRWDMPLEEVRKLYPHLEELGRERSGPFYGDVAIIREIEPGIQATLNFEREALRQIRLSALDEKALWMLLTSQFGEPHKTNSLTNTSCHISFADWNDRSRNYEVRLRLYSGTGLEVSDCSAKGGDAVLKPVN